MPFPPDIIPEGEREPIPDPTTLIIPRVSIYITSVVLHPIPKSFSRPGSGMVTVAQSPLSSGSRSLHAAPLPSLWRRFPDRAQLVRAAHRSRAEDCELQPGVHVTRVVETAAHLGRWAGSSIGRPSESTGRCKDHHHQQLGQDMFLLVQYCVPARPATGLRPVLEEGT